MTRTKAGCRAVQTLDEDLYLAEEIREVMKGFPDRFLPRDLEAVYVIRHRCVPCGACYEKALGPTPVVVTVAEARKWLLRLRLTCPDCGEPLSPTTMTRLLGRSTVMGNFHVSSVRHEVPFIESDAPRASEFARQGGACLGLPYAVCPPLFDVIFDPFMPSAPTKVEALDDADVAHVRLWVATAFGVGPLSVMRGTYSSADYGGPVYTNAQMALAMAAAIRWDAEGRCHVDPKLNLWDDDLRAFGPEFAKAYGAEAHVEATRSLTK